MNSVYNVVTPALLRLRALNVGWVYLLLCCLCANLSHQLAG